MNIDPHGLLANEEHDLVSVMQLASNMPNCPRFIIVQGLRNVAQEAANVAKGASQTMHSRHLPDKTHHLAAAVDVACLDAAGITWDVKAYQDLAPFIKTAAEKLKIPIEWGGDWHTLKDFGHWQLPWAYMP